MKSHGFPAPVRLAVVIATVWLWSAMAAIPASAQLVPSATPPNAPANGIRQEGIYVTAPVTLDGIELFRVAQLANAPPNQLSIEQRSAYIQNALDQIVATTAERTGTTTAYDPRTLRIHVHRTGDVVVLEAVDAKHPDPLPLVTVTSLDAQYHQASSDALATQWQAVLQSGLTQALLIRQPLIERETFDLALRFGAVLVAFTVLAGFVIGWLLRRAAKLADVVAARDKVSEAQRPPTPEAPSAERQRRRTFALALRVAEPAQQLILYRACADSLLWLLGLLWLAAAIWLLSRFPQTATLGSWLRQSVLGVALVLIVAGLLNRVLDIVIARVTRAVLSSGAPTSEERARKLLRVPTVIRSISGFKTFILVFLAGLAIVNQVGAPIGSVVTLGGLAALAVSLAAQNLVRDFLNGLLVLLEDQYVVGDYVTINGYSGTVETLTLRMVQIRDASGDVITIPHSSVTSVVNQSRNWSRVDYRIPVDPEADVDKAIALVRKVVEDLAKGKKGGEGILEPIEWIGIESIAKEAVVIRASIKTAPLRQFELRRTINELVCRAFIEAGIGFGAQLPV